MKTPNFACSKFFVFFGGLALGLGAALLIVLRGGGDIATKAHVAEVFGLLENDVASLERALDPSLPRLFEDPADVVREGENRQAAAQKMDLESGVTEVRRKLALLLRQTLQGGREVDFPDRDHVVFAAERSGEEFPWSVPGGTVAEGVRVSNTGSSVADAVRVVIDGTPVPASLQELVSRAVHGAGSEEERAIGLWNLVVQGRRHDWPAHPEASDPLKLLHVYGYGFCSHAANTLALLAAEAGLESRIQQAKGWHVVTEIKINGKWSMFDPDGEMFVRLSDGTIASVAELQADPALVETATPGFYTAEKLRGIYRDGDFKVRKPFLADPTRALNVRLRPGESIGYAKKRGGLFYLTRYLEEPAEYANGDWTFSPVWENGAWLNGSGGAQNLEVARGADGISHLVKSDPRKAAELIYLFEIPYPVLDGSIFLGGDADVPSVEISRDGQTWIDLPTTTSCEGAAAGLVPFLSIVGGDPDYRFMVRFKWPASASRVHLSHLSFRYDLQMAPAQLPLPRSDSRSVGVVFEGTAPAELKLDFALSQRTASER